jgi:hypothetical protein
MEQRSAHHVPVIAVWLLAAAVNNLAAAPPSIASISPRGAQRGQTVTIIIEGANLSEGAEVVSSLPAPFTLVTGDENLKPAPNRLAFRVPLSPGEAPAPYPLRVRTKGGLSNPVLFVAGALPEAAEEEPNETPAEARPITLPVTVNGRLGATDRDTFRFTARKGDRLVFEVEARRIGSSVDPTLRLLRANGGEVALSEDAYGLDVDARIDHVMEEDGEHFVQVHDAMYLARSPDFYRLKAGAFLYAEAVFPLGGRAGSDVELRFEGGNLAAPLTTRVRLDPDPVEPWTRVSLPVEAGGASPFRIKVGTLHETFELPREKPDAVQPISPETTLNGRIDLPREVDRYALDVTPGERYVVSIEAAALGSWLDPVLGVFREDGQRILMADDEGTNPDPRAELAVPDGVKRVHIHVEDLHRRGGKAFGYRLTAARQRPDFALRLNTLQANLPLKGTALVEVECIRRGHGGPVRLRVVAPPVGFAVRGGEILPDQTKGYLTLTGPEAGEHRSLELAVVGEGGTALEPLVRRAQGVLYLASDQKQPASPLPVGAVACAITEPPVLALATASDLVEVPVGHSSELAVSAARGEGAGGELKLAGITAPPGVSVAEAKVAAGQPGGTVTISAAPGAALREGDLIVAASTKAGGSEVVAPAPAIRVRVVPPFAVDLAANAVEGPAGATVSIQGRVVRRGPFQGKVDGKLDGLPAGMSGGPFEVTPEKSEFQVEVSIPKETAPGVVNVRLILSTPLGDPKSPVIHTVAPVPVAITIKPARAVAAAPAEPGQDRGRPGQDGGAPAPPPATK